MLGSVEKGIWVGFSAMNIITVCVWFIEQYIAVVLRPRAGILTWDQQAQETEDIKLPQVSVIFRAQGSWLSQGIM